MKMASSKQQFTVNKQTGSITFHSCSEHPIPTTNSIIFSQALKIKRICSEESEFKNGCEHLKERLKKRGYKEENIAIYIEKASTIDRKEFPKREDVTEKKSKIDICNGI